MTNRFAVAVAALTLCGCIDFGASESAFCATATPEQRATACTDKLGAEPAGLSITGAPASLTAGTCSGAVKVQAVDTSTLPAIMRVATPVALNATPPSGVTFYSDDACTSPTSLVTLGAGQDSVSFAFKSSTVGSVTLSATATGLTDGTKHVDIARGNGNGLAVTTAPQTIGACACSSAITVQLQDGGQNPIQFSTDTPLGLASDAVSGVTFYTAAGCSGAAVTAATIPANQSTVTIYLKASTAGPLVITISGNSLVNATQTETIQPGPPSKLAMTTAGQSPIAGSCSGVVTVQTQDAFNNTTRVASATTLNLSAAPATGVTFYADAACSNGITQAIVAANTSSASFYFKATVAGSVTVSAASTGLTTGTQSETVRAGTPAKLAFTSAPVTLTAGACSAITTIQSRDAYDNPSSVSGSVAVALTASAAATTTFYTDATCATATTRATIATGQTSGTFYFRSTRVGLVTLTATAAGYTSDFVDETIVAGPPVKIGFTTAPITVAVNTVSSTLTTVTVQDAYDNASPITAAQSQFMNIQISGGYACLAANDCGYSGFNVAAGSSSVSFYLRFFSSGTRTVTATFYLAPNQVTASQDETVTP